MTVTKPVQLVFLLEEPSMKNTLQEIIPRIVDLDVPPLYLAFEGKHDLELNFPRKLQGWQSPPDREIRFVIVRDNDGHPRCMKLKNRLKDLCITNGHPQALVRLVCQELESWFLGDLEAVGKAFDNKKLSGLQRQVKFRNPDQLTKPSKELLRLVPDYQKFGSSRTIAQHMDPARNRSKSFEMFVAGIRTLVNAT
ncbi:MAG: DUF4276 family protein [Magnetococcales bacterium]|nr:DUF4276 family protein [Magnetococcales bacterium]